MSDVPSEEKVAVSRRDFLRKSGSAAAAITVGGNLLTGCAITGESPAILPGGPLPSDKIRLGLIGARNRGSSVMREFMQNADVEVIAICDPDAGVADEAAKAVVEKYGRAPQIDKDYRAMLENKDLDAVLIATPDHWHCLPFCHACELGLDVYVEKPISHNIVEGRAMVNASREYNRVAQVGTQQRSAAHFAEAVQVVQSGVLGQISLVRTWNNDYEPNGLGKSNTQKPDNVDYDLWLGPAPLVPFDSNRFHYQWRWFFDYAGGMICDWGIHLIDIAMWGMKAEYPDKVSALGDKYGIRDNRTTPDTLLATYQFGATPIAPKGFVMTYENSKIAARGTRGESERNYGIEFYGENGSLYVNRGGYEIIPAEVDGRELIEAAKVEGNTPSQPHVRNFLDCMKSRNRPISDIEIGHRSTSTPHLGNIAYRTGETLHWDGEKEIIMNHKAANKLLGRRYRKPWDKEAKHLLLDRRMKRLLT